MLCAAPATYEAAGVVSAKERELIVDLELTGKRAIVTGGSRGIGKAIARELAREGADVVIAARGKDKLEATAAELSAETGRRVVPLVVDTGDETSVNALVERAVAALGGVDILVNNAALPGGISPATRLDQIVDAQVIEDINIKVVGYLRTARAVAPHLIANGWGRIINIGGLAVRKTGRPVATLRNVGVAAITKNLADELGPKGINVTVVHPGATRTERVRPEPEKDLAASVSIGRIVDAREVAWVVTFLASPRSVAINGDSVVAGGGSVGPIYY
ncbi:short-chain dehydrogenase [Sorangium cellulosum So0157-2]|uniref:Short-chain dehydrogenase n=1 Tax=Sorangium cellulosum So0157-2 TaxID=1254432 RepID=S4XYW5_SORCE|nr:short-chain dehydrogenase [Sorangium cellulosum So0157-2]